MAQIQKSLKNAPPLPLYQCCNNERITSERLRTIQLHYQYWGIFCVFNVFPNYYAHDCYMEIIWLEQSVKRQVTGERM